MAKKGSLEEILAEDGKEFSYSKSESEVKLVPKKPAMWKNLKSEEILQKVQKDMKWGEDEKTESDKP